MSAKASHIFSTKNIGVFEILRFEILMNETVTKDVVSFEQPGPGLFKDEKPGNKSPR